MGISLKMLSVKKTPKWNTLEGTLATNKWSNNKKPSQLEIRKKCCQFSSDLYSQRHRIFVTVGKWHLIIGIYETKSKHTRTKNCMHTLLQCNIHIINSFLTNIHKRDMPIKCNFLIVVAVGGWPHCIYIITKHPILVVRRRIPFSRRLWQNALNLALCCVQYFHMMCVCVCGACI